jgi:hypothetical protein
LDAHRYRLECGLTMAQATATRPVAEATGERPRPRRGGLAIAGLLVLSVLPIVGGVARLGELGAKPDSAPPAALTVAIVAHIVAMSVLSVLGAFQFSPVLRRRSLWHRTAGRALLPLGFIAAVSSIVLVLLFSGPAEELPLALIRLVFGVAMTVFLVPAVLAIRRRDFTAHGAWMTRAYALAISGGTQAIASIVLTVVLGELDASGEAWAVAAGFVTNSVVAELLIRRRSGRKRGHLASA